MDKHKTTVIMACVMAALFAPAALAQGAQGAPGAQATAAKVAVVSGNGQLICPVCAYKTAHFFYPLVVKVTDVNGNPITGKTVNWDLVSFMGGSEPSFDTVSITDSDGLAYSRLSQNAGQGGSSLQPFLQSVIRATADNAIATFTETMALTDLNNGTLFYSATLDAPTGPLTGPAGSTGTSPIRIRIGNAFVPFPGVSVRIQSPEVTSTGGLVTIDPNQPSASCQTGQGADPGSVLSDATGLAICYPVFGPVAGTGFVSALIGGLDPIEFDQSLTPQPLSGPIAFDQFNGIQLIVAQVTPGRINIISGNNQTVNAGHAASDPLVVQVTNAAGTVPVGNQSIVWSVFPAGAATVNPATSTTDSQGRAQTTVTFSAVATGQITIRATLPGSNVNPAAFNLSTAVLISSLTKVSGDLQTTQSGQNFPAPLIVQVIGTNTLPLSNQPIGFSVTDGVATLSTLSALTDATGQARVTVTAGAVPGSVTVKAFIATFSTSFTLNVIPPGPALTSNSFYNAGGLTKISAISPCSLVTVIASGLAPNVQGLAFNPTSFGPWATSLASDTVLVGSVNAPIYSVGSVDGAEQLTFQVPCETAPAAGVPITIGVGGGTATIAFPVVAASPGIFETVMSDGVRRAVAVRPDGTFVNLLNPARRGETIRVFVTGLGPTNPAMVTGSVPVPGVDSLAYGQVIVGLNNGGAGPNIARVSPNLIGVYEVSFQVPSDARTGSDVVLSVAVNVPGDTNSSGQQVTRFSNGSKLPIFQ